MQTTDLQSRVNALSYEDLVEAANFFLPQAIGTADLVVVEQRLATMVQEQGGIYAQLKETLREVQADELSIEHLLRSVLLSASEGTAEDRRRVVEALDGIGKSQVVVELMYAIFAATTLGLVWLAIPPRETTTTVTREYSADGSQRDITKTTVKEIPPPVDKLFGWIKGVFSPGSKKE